MRTIRILASLAAVFAASAVAAASAAAAPEFDAEKFPVKVEGAATNFQGFGDSLGAIASVCETATAETEVEGDANPTGNSASVKVHPIYGSPVKPTKCNLTLLGAASGEALVNSEGCQYTFHAVNPGKPEAATDVVCGKTAATPTAGNCKIPTGGVAGEPCLVRIEATFLAGCVISVPAQANLQHMEYKNEPVGETKINAEVSNITTKISTGCGVGKTEVKSEYREGEIVAGKSKLAPAGKPATLGSKGKFGVEADPIEVGANEPHWYENHVALAAQSGEPGQEGTDVLMWGKMTFGSTEVGTTNCQTIWGGDVYNTQGGGKSYPFGNAKGGKSTIDAMHAYDCAEPVGENCEVAGKGFLSKLSVEPEELGGVRKNGTVVEPQEWEAHLTPLPPVRMVIGNETAASKTAIQLHAVCPATTEKEYNAKWTGQLSPQLTEQGTAQGSSPTKFEFNSGTLKGARTLPTAGEESVTAGNTLKMMGYEGGEIVSTKNP
jgi:hypothetical protein